MKLHRLWPVLVLLMVAACASRPAPTLTPVPAATNTAQPAASPASTQAQTTDTPAAAATPANGVATFPPALTAAPTDTQAADTPTPAVTSPPAPTTLPTELTAAPSDTPTAAATETPADTATPAATDTPAATLSPATILGQHTVQPGETLFCIARGYGVLPAAIAQANGLNETLLIYPNQVLKIPAAPWSNPGPGPVCAPQFASPFAGPTPTPVPSPTLPAFPATVTPPPFTPLPPASILGQHVVKPGETVFCIGRGYGVLPAAIAQANGLGSTLQINSGQTLNIPAVQWVDIPVGPVCPTQFTSPYPGLVVMPTATPGS